jgi:hypothetical protein
VHGLRGQPSNRRLDAARRQKILQAYRRRYADFGPTFACEKLASEGLGISPQTLRRWLIAEGLRQRQRRRDPHRSRRPRRCRFGELVQMDASIHHWLEGRREEMVLISMIDDAASRVLARFYPASTTEAHLPRSLTHRRPTPAGKNAKGAAPEKGAEPPGVQPTDGRSGRTPAKPYPPDGAGKNNDGKSRRPAENHPWRRSFKKAK